MAKNTKLVLLRLEKQAEKLRTDPIDQAWIARQGVLNFHFCIHGLDGPYQGGFYHGLLQLTEDYPFSPPQLLFFTPSGRFEVNKSICTTFTNYHKQSWTSSWNVRTMVLGTILFMNSEQTGAGYVSSSYLSKRQYARDSLAFNQKNPLFKELFKKQLADYRKNKSERQEDSRSGAPLSEDEKKRSNYSSLWLYLLYFLLVIIIAAWVKMNN